MHKFFIEISVVVTGAVIMILELCGSRTLSPYLGNSIIIWTSIIGIILAFLSLGYYLGGKIADKKASPQNLSQIVITAAILIAISTIIKDNFLQILTTTIQDIRISSIIATVVLFGPVNIFLGMISPYCVKLKIDNISHSGATVGRLSALATIGSIIGTFLGGFYLISFFGNTKLLLLLSFILGLLAIFIDSKNHIKTKILVIALISLKFIDLQIVSANFENTHLLNLDTTYNHVQIEDTISTENNLPIRLLWIDKNAQSGVYLKEKSNELLFEYTKFYDLAFHFNPSLKKALMIGGGAFTYPQYFINNHPNAKIDVVEIDNQLPSIAQKYFHLKPNKNLKIFSEDGRSFLNQNQQKYDAILGDAFHGYYSIPYQLTTKEAMQKISDSLNENGVFIINVIAAIEGPKSKFLQAEYKTLKEVFPQIYILQAKPNKSPSSPQNLMVIALKSTTPVPLTSKNPTAAKQLSGLWTKPIAQDIEMLTDDFAPVDNYMLELLK